MNTQDTLTLRKLDIFLAFMRLGNLARVAEEMELSTVSVHRALHALEDAVGCPLFRREGRNLQPLDTAYAFAGHARRCLDECRQGLDKVRDMAGVNTPRLRIGSLYSLTLHCIPQVIIGLKLRRPELHVDLSMDSSRGLIESLQNGRLDAIIMGANEPQDHPRLLSVPMFEDALYFAAPAGSRYASASKDIDLASARNEKFVMLGSGFVTSESFVNTFRLAGYEPDVAMQVGDIFSLINLVGQGMGCSLLPGRVAAFSDRVCLKTLQPRYRSRQRIALMLASSREHDPNLPALAQECRAYGLRKDLRRPPLSV